MSVRASERNSVVVGSNPTHANCQLSIATSNNPSVVRIPYKYINWFRTHRVLNKHKAWSVTHIVKS